MANFKEHVSFGAATGFALSMTIYLIDWITNVYFMVIVFFVTIIGSILPDMDSNTGLPIKIIFGLYAYASAALTIFYLNELDLSIYYKIFLPIASFAFVSTSLKSIFRKFTSHRGIFHSIPAFLIVFFLALTIADTTHLKTAEKFIISASISLGYFSHLLLDEIYSINLIKRNKRRHKGKRLSLKKYIKNNFGLKNSFGTALDFGFNQKEKYPGIIAYLILIFLVYITYPTLIEIFNSF